MDDYSRWSIHVAALTPPHVGYFIGTPEEARAWAIPEWLLIYYTDTRLIFIGWYESDAPLPT